MASVRRFFPSPLPALLLVLAGCAPRFAPARLAEPVLEPPAVTVDRIELRYANVHLLRARGAVALVDSGTPDDAPLISSALDALGLRPEDVKVVILTHGHGDHAGSAAFFQKRGAKILLGRGDETQTTAGHNDEMIPTSWFGSLLKPFVKFDYPPLSPDVLVDDELDLAPWGFPGVRALRMPGHTRGSLVVLLGGREAVVGDQMLGGVWGGLFHAETPGEHYYQLDPGQNRRNIAALLARGIERFHLGHGGPVTRDAVLTWQRNASER
jgi:hydroxyacylglutathione hydrolase